MISRLKRRTLLDHISLLGERGATAAEISEDFSVRRTTPYPMLKRLESCGLICRGKVQEKRGANNRSPQTVYFVNRQTVPEPLDRMVRVREYHAQTGLYIGVKVCCLKCSYKFDSAMGECPVCHSAIVPFPVVEGARYRVGDIERVMNTRQKQCGLDRVERPIVP